MQETLGLSVDSTELPRQVSRDDFWSLAGQKLVQQRQAIQAFGLFDAAGKGVVILEDLQRVAAELGEEMTDDELQEMIEEVDRSGEGLLTKEDFIQIAQQIRL